MKFHPDTIYAQLYPHFQQRVRRNEPLSRHGVLGTGGPADLWVSLESRQELQMLVTFCAERHVPLLIIGNGSNILFLEKGVRGIVARMAANAYTIEEQVDGTALVLAEAGVNLPHLIHKLVPHGWGNLEFGINIPGTLGGSIVTNAGTYHTGLGHYIRWIEVLDARGSNLEDDEQFAVPLVRRYNQNELDLRYRHSRLREQRCASFNENGQLAPAPHHLINPGEIVLRLALTVQREQPELLYERMKRYETHQQQRIESGRLYASPIFRDPPEGTAAELIAQAGLRGLRVGQVMVSINDANAIVNEGKTSSAEVLALITTMHQQVLTQLGVDLALDIELQGDWTNSQEQERSTDGQSLASTSN